MFESQFRRRIVWTGPGVLGSIAFSVDHGPLIKISNGAGLTAAFHHRPARFFPFFHYPLQLDSQPRI
jgi:hypothetical protein